MAGIEITDLHKRYPDGTVAVETVDLSMRDGELFVMLGPSGCGKTTTLRAIAGLERQTSGIDHEPHITSRRFCRPELPDCHDDAGEHQRSAPRGLETILRSSPTRVTSCIRKSNRSVICVSTGRQNIGRAASPSTQGAI